MSFRWAAQLVDRCPVDGPVYSPRISSYIFLVLTSLLLYLNRATSLLLTQNYVLALDSTLHMSKSYKAGLGSFPDPYPQDRAKMQSGNFSKCSRKIDQGSLCRGFKMLDAEFLSESKMLEIEKGAEELNIPIIQSNRKLVASANGGLENPSSLVFTSAWNHHDGGDRNAPKRFNYPSVSNVQRPKRDDDIAFMSILELGHLIKSKQITSEELTRIFLNRLKRYGPVLESVITITEELAYEQAKRADQLLAEGKYIGPLHGIPYGLKDIIAVPHYKTTWGCKTFKNQVLDIEAWVYKRLKSAGAVLLAKLVTGSLAYDDIWFGGRTRNPWNIEEYSTGSSAGPASSTSAGHDGIDIKSPKCMFSYLLYSSKCACLLEDARSEGLVPFAIGSETAGSITYPAARCGSTALRPTFGTVGRTGVLSLSESLDKLGPFCRDATDCAIVLDVIRGKDPDDLSSKNIPFSDPFAVDVTKLNVGYLEDAEMEVVEKLRSKGVNMIPFKLNYTVESAQGILNFTMDVDMLAHFDQWQRLGLDDDYEAQDQWPLELRRARVVPAVDYIQAQRARGKLIREVRESFKVDAFVGNATDWELVCVGNLVGMPVVVLPTGFKQITDAPSNQTRRKTTVPAGLYALPGHDHIALALAMAYQSVTDHHKQRPPIDDLGPGDSIPNPPTRAIPPRQLR
ncbi:glutamyl-tRNA(Gln) amidotransferase subunit A [Striga asiatica]|uniref:Glutamyl-tRNA(Gln) amidotransferase subunit A n=1 Tax=Striga asiatica TaxID=4170 RepID=A0A5A7QX87_STRAF|nr:glutamyl-tRNA(Gln) amidotransferase subunit A [Striga asiatica]